MNKSPTILQEERDILEHINNYRKEKNLKSLGYHDFMSNLARSHSQNMANKKVAFSHDQMDQRFSMIKGKGSGYITGTENVYYSKPNIGDPVASWKNSSGHNRNMLLPNATHCGIGYAINPGSEHYVTAMFAEYKK